MIRVNADLNELCDRLGVNNEEIEHYLDVETGKVIMWMDPIVTVVSSSLRDRLERALNGRKSFRAFKDVLCDFPEEREQWFKFEHDAHRQQVLQWLELNHISLDPM